MSRQGKRLVLLLSLCLASAAPVMAQGPGDPNEGSRIEWDSTNQIWRFSWWGRTGQTYFVQHSDDLAAWTYVPIIEPGNNAIREWGFTSNGDKFFLRLKHTNEPASDPSNADFDRDGVSNMDELAQGTDPFHNADDDADGMPNDWELHFGLNPSAGSADANQDPDGDGLTNAEEFLAGRAPSQANAVPPTQGRNYAIIPITNPVDEYDPRGLTNAGQVVYYGGIWNAGQISLSQGTIWGLSHSGFVAEQPATGNQGTIRNLQDGSVRTLSLWSTAEILQLIGDRMSGYTFDRVTSNSNGVDLVSANGKVVGGARADVLVYETDAQGNRIERTLGTSKRVWWDESGTIHTLQNLMLGEDELDQFVSYPNKAVNDQGQILCRIDDGHPEWPNGTPVLYDGWGSTPVILGNPWQHATSLNNRQEIVGSNFDGKALLSGAPIGRGEAVAVNDAQIQVTASGGTTLQPFTQILADSASGPVLWQKSLVDGSYLPQLLNQHIGLISAPSGPQSEWQLWEARDVNDFGVILATGAPRDTNGTPIYDQYGHLILLPLEVSVKKQGDASPPTDGVLVRAGDVLEIKLNDIPQENSPLNRDQIVWEYQQLKRDGSFTGWQAFGDHGKGVKFEHTTTTGGIFQIKAILTVNGEQQEHLYVRKRDEPNATESGGSYNEDYRKGKPDFVGVVDADWQIGVRREARLNLGNAAYATSVALVLYPGGPIMRGADPNAVPPFEGDNKCNAFVFHKATDGGAPVPLTRGGGPIPGYYTSPPLAYDWWDFTYTITGWSRLGDSSFPQPGYIVAGPDEDANPSIDRRWGHTGILDYDGGWINAGRLTVNKWPHLSIPQEHPYQPAGFRKYTGP